MNAWPVLVVAAALLAGCEMEPRYRVQLRPVPAGQATPSPLPPVNRAAPAPAVGEAPQVLPSTPTSDPAPPVTARMGAASGGENLDGAALLAARPLVIPVQGVRPGALRDHYDQARGSRKHEAIDIMAPTGTPVHAVDDGRLAKVFTSKAGGLTLYQFDPGERLAYYYAHLDRYADGLKEGMVLRKGDVIGYVGSTGNVGPNSPHLHFAVFVLGPKKLWWQGEPVNPYPALRRAATITAAPMAQR
jgi:murein DD-endopeptidase MepM/ murein hydrolase activator NlpD